jgi:hydroxymethylpyrimidine pyrophosphatase-like HAD family hydrolase
MRKSLLIAVDFDGTIVEDAYPKVGKPMPFALETIKMLQADGHRIILRKGVKGCGRIHD